MGISHLCSSGFLNTLTFAHLPIELNMQQLGGPLSLDTQIPDHPYFPLYAPSFILDVPAGNMQDQNSEDYLCTLDEAFAGVVAEMTERMAK
jgi:histone deacetylase 8